MSSFGDFLFSARKTGWDLFFFVCLIMVGCRQGRDVVMMDVGHVTGCGFVTRAHTYHVQIHGRASLWQCFFS